MSLEGTCIVRPESKAPLPNQFPGHRDATLGEQLLDVTEDNTESVAESNRANNRNGAARTAAMLKRV